MLSNNRIKKLARLSQRAGPNRQFAIFPDESEEEAEKRVRSEVEQEKRRLLK